MEIGAIKDAEPSSSGGYIEHHVSKLDTLPGIAIKYGVEVSDIKRLNGLASDFQMYARCSLQIPLPGRHPPAEPLTPISRSNNRRSTASEPHPPLEPRPPLGKQFYPSSYTFKKKTFANDFAVFNRGDFERQKVSSAKGLLHGYYGLKSSENLHSDEMEMLLSESDADAHSKEDPFTHPRVLRPPKTQHFSVVNGDSPQTAIGVSQQEKNKQKDLTLGNGPSCNNVLSYKSKMSSKDSGLPKMDRSSVKVVRRRTKAEEGSEPESEISAVRLLPFPSPFAWASRGRTPIEESSNESKRFRGPLLVVEELISKIRRSASASNLQDEKKVSQGNCEDKGGNKELLDASSQALMLILTRLNPTSRSNKVD